MFIDYQKNPLFLWIKVLFTLGGCYTEGTCLYCDYFLLGISCIRFVLVCTVVALYCFVKCGFCNVWACVCARVCSFVLSGCFGNM